MHPPARYADSPMREHPGSASPRSAAIVATRSPYRLLRPPRPGHGGGAREQGREARPARCFVRVTRLHQRDLDGEAGGHRPLQMRGVCAEVLDLAAALLGDHADHHVVVGAGRVVAADAAPDPLRYRTGPLGGVGAHSWPSRWKPGARTPLKWAACAPRYWIALLGAAESANTM